MATLHLVPLYLRLEPGALERIGAHVGQVYDLAARARTPGFDPERAYDGRRGQYDSTRLLACLLEEAIEDGDKILGLAGVDLFIPVLTYVFGEAQLGGRAAVVSTWRLDSAVYGLPPDDDLRVARLEKEALHEIGHTYGLVHCPDVDCVMRASTYVEEIDLKPAALCEDCTVEVAQAGRRPEATGRIP